MSDDRETMSEDRSASEASDERAAAAPSGRARAKRILFAVAGWAFVVAVLVALVLSFRDDVPALLAALVGAEPWTLLLVLVGTVAVTAGLLPVWRTLLRACGHAIGVRAAARILYVGQLGKYLPGSVWTVGAQATMLRRHAVPARVGVGLGLLLVVAQLAGASAIAAGAGLLGAGVLAELPIVAAVLLVLVGVGLVPAVLRLVVRLATGATVRLPARDWAIVVSALLASWLAQTLAIVPFATGAGWSTATAAVAGGFAAAYVAGLVVILAPAGLGVREGVLAAVLTPVVGPGPALATALVTRVSAAAVDVTVAAVAAWSGRRRGEIDPAD